jgi:hypothetical protein
MHCLFTLPIIAAGIVWLDNNAMGRCKLIAMCLGTQAKRVVALSPRLYPTFALDAPSNGDAVRPVSGLDRHRVFCFTASLDGTVRGLRAIVALQ